MDRFLFVGFLILLLAPSSRCGGAAAAIVDARKLQMFVDELPDMPKLLGYGLHAGALVPGNLTIGMFETTWKFHWDLPPTRVFAYGTSREAATVPGPTIEARRGIPTSVTWLNHLPSRHILPWDPTIPNAASAAAAGGGGGVPTVVHLHGGIHGPASDGNPNSWFTSGFRSTGPTWSSPSYLYPNVQHPGNLWYHDHAMGLTRVNILAGLLGAYNLRSPELEGPLGLPSGPEFDRNLIIFDRSFSSGGAKLYINGTGDNPSIHPSWQPEFFGSAIVVNGKAWPRMTVRTGRRYRLRILNACNARFLRLSLSGAGSIRFTHVGSDSAYLPRPTASRSFLLAPSEIADVVVDFAAAPPGASIVMRNDAAHPYPSGNPADAATGVVMKFVVTGGGDRDPSRIPRQLLRYSPAAAVAAERYVAMYEYESGRTGEPTHLYLNGKPYEAPATETPRKGTSEVWWVINLTEDNHPLHVHLAMIAVMEQREIVGMEELKRCMMAANSGGGEAAVACRAGEHVRGRVARVPRHERGWKNVVKIRPGFVTSVLLRFDLLGPGNTSYPFDATSEPGYVYHCHILDHEDNAMMRPLKILP